MCCKTLFNLTNSPPISCFLLLLNHLIPAVLASCFCPEYSGTLQTEVLSPDCSSSWDMFPDIHITYSFKVFLKCPLLDDAYCDLFKIMTPPISRLICLIFFPCLFFFPKSFNTFSHTVSFTYLFLLCLLSASCSLNVSSMRSGIVFCFFTSVLCSP